MLRAFGGLLCSADLMGATPAPDQHRCASQHSRAHNAKADTCAVQQQVATLKTL